MAQTSISVVVAAWRDAAPLGVLLGCLDVTPDVELVVATAADEPREYEHLKAAHPRVRWVTAPRGRASQMNAGAASARGEWLLFLHADSRLPSAWRDAVEAAARTPGMVGGSYRLVFDSRAWQARLIEAGVRLRVGVLGLPYGDQGLFVRRDVFEAVGGFRDLPLMEDIDLVWRLKRQGGLLHHHLPVTTSARRWERDGWLRRSAGNVTLASLYLAGVPAATLARRYVGRRRATVGMLARAPWLAGKTRLVETVPPAEHRALREALFLDTLDAVRSVASADSLVLVEPAEACSDVRAMVGEHADVVAQRDGDLGDRMAGGFADLFRLGASHVVLVGSDLPSLPPRSVRAAVEALSRHGDRVVLGPADDGGYYLVGLKRPHPELFAGVEWSAPRVLEQTVARARGLELEVHLVEPWYDVDEWADLGRLATEPPDRARRTREWLTRNVAGARR